MKGTDLTGSGNQTEKQLGYNGGHSDEGRKRNLVSAFSQPSKKFRMIVQELREVQQRGDGEVKLIFPKLNTILDISKFQAITMFAATAPRRKERIW